MQLFKKMIIIKNYIAVKKYICRILSGESRTQDYIYTTVITLKMYAYSQKLLCCHRGLIVQHY